MSETVEGRLARLRNVGDIGELLPWISSWELALVSEGKADKTIRGYTDAMVRMANWLLNLAEGRPLVRDWSEVSRTHFRQYMQWFQSAHSKVYANNQYRALQQFWKWYSIEEDTPDPMENTKPPKVPERLMPMLSGDDMMAVIKDAEKGRDFVSRRDAAILRFHGCTGCRLSEIAGLLVNKVNVKDRVAAVIGKGDIERLVQFDHKCAVAIDRYLRTRTHHKYAARKELWLAARNRPPLTRDGVYQLVARRGRQLGIHVHPHMFRHTFSHNWLDKGGTEGDLMSLNGWKSRQMLGHYGAEGRSLRARRHYDTIDVMGGE